MAWHTKVYDDPTSRDARADAAEIHPARPEDAASMVRLVRAGFAAELHPLMIYGCRGAASFIRAQLAIPSRFADRQFTVARSLRDGTVVGCVDMVRADDRLFLSYIVTEPAYRGARLATRLLLAAVERARTPSHETIALDVLRDNAVAREWYDRLAFDHASSTWWLEMPSAPVAEATEHTSVRVAGLAQADAVHASFGFSQFTLEIQGQCHTIGRLGDSWFRLSTAEALADRRVRDTLRALDPHRRVLAIVPVAAIPSPPPGSTPLACMDRLVAPLEAVLDRLAYWTSTAARPSLPRNDP